MQDNNNKVKYAMIGFGAFVISALAYKLLSAKSSQTDAKANNNERLETQESVQGEDLVHLEFEPEGAAIPGFTQEARGWDPQLINH